MESSMDRRSGINTALKSQKSALLDSHSQQVVVGIHSPLSQAFHAGLISSGHRRICEEKHDADKN
jgi:hypothetical protein